MRLRHIEVIHAIVLSGSVSGAARMLSVTQPAVSRTLAHAELQLGFALFQRAGGRLVPTPEAQTLFPHIERVFAQLGEVQRLSANLKTGHGQGRLRVLTVPGLGLEAFPRAVQRFRAKHPGVLIEHQTLHSQEIAAALALQEADVGYVYSAASHPALAQERLASGRVVCAVPKGLLPADTVHSGRVALAQLAGLPVIGLAAGDPLGTVIAHALQAEDVLLDAVVTVQTYHVALALAEHGVGAALIEDCSAASANRAHVDVLAIEPAISTTVHALRLQAQPPSLVQRAFTRAMQQALSAP